jgi:hypothetical protein
MSCRVINKQQINKLPSNTTVYLILLQVSYLFPSPRGNISLLYEHFENKRKSITMNIHCLVISQITWYFLLFYFHFVYNFVIAIHKLGHNILKKTVRLIIDIFMRNINTTFQHSCYVRSHKTVHNRGYALTFTLPMLIQKPDDGER